MPLLGPWSLPTIAAARSIIYQSIVASLLLGRPETEMRSAKGLARCGGLAGGHPGQAAAVSARGVGNLSLSHSRISRFFRANRSPAHLSFFFPTPTDHSCSPKLPPAQPWMPLLRARDEPRGSIQPEKEGILGFRHKPPTTPFPLTRGPLRPASSLVPGHGLPCCIVRRLIPSVMVTFWLLFCLLRHDPSIWFRPLVCQPSGNQARLASSELLGSSDDGARKPTKDETNWLYHWGQLELARCSGQGFSACS